MVKTPFILLGVVNGTSKILGLINFSSDLEILTAFAKSLEVLFVVHLFRSQILACWSWSVRFSNKGLSVSVSLFCWLGQIDNR